MLVAIQLSSGKISCKCSTKHFFSHAFAAQAMNVIDLEILIPASPEFIWRFLGDPSTIPQWQEDTSSIAFLSTQREGRGTRWRQSSHRNGDVVVEVGAWYDTLGYEYQIVDGARFSENQGRIKLHEVPEGTLVNWMFQYELGGLFGGIRNAMRLKGSTSSQIQDSLRNLHHLIMRESGGIPTHEAKASMQDAPDVTERLSYRPRHPSSFQDAGVEELEAETGDGTPATDRQPAVYEIGLEPAPASTDTDTKPNPVVLSTFDSPSEESPAETELEDTRPIELEALLAEPRFVDQATSKMPDAIEPTPETSAPAAADDAADAEPASRVVEKPRFRQIDSAHVSVFEIFGLQKPSEAAKRQGAPSAAPRDSVVEPVAIPQSPAVVNPPAISMKANDGAQTPTYPAGLANGGITGLRRQSRRRKPRLRSHN